MLDRYAYLNAGTFGPLPRATVEAMEAVLRRELEEGRSNRPYFEQALADRERLREAFAGLIGAGKGCVALTTSTTEGCNIAIGGLGIGPGDEVVTTDSEHPGLFGGLVASGATLRIAAIRDLPAADLLPALEAQITPQTRLVAISHVSWLTGVVLPVAELAGRGIPLLVDGAQAAGTIPVDVGELGCDFYTVSAQKWLLGPAATGALYVHPDRVEKSRVAFPSYFSWQLPDYELVEGAGRFEGSWTPVSSVAGMLASFGFMTDAGQERFARAREAAERCRALLLERGADVVTEPGQATLVAWRAEDPPALVASLAEAGVVVRDLPGTGLVRASCGFWTSEDDLERLVRGLQTAPDGRLVLEQELDDDDVAPHAVESGVASVDADLAEAELPAKDKARLVLREDPADELPEAARAGLCGQRLQRDATGAPPARLARDVDREVANAPVGIAVSPVRRGGGPGEDGALLALHDHEREAFVEPRLDVRSRPLACLEGGQPVGDPLVVDACDRLGVLRPRGTGSHGHGG